MKHIYVTFEDWEMEDLKESKGKQSWRKFILDKCIDKDCSEAESE